MKIEFSLFDHMVLQRTARNVSDAAFGGKCKAAGELKARVRRGDKVVRGLDWVRVGQARGGKFAGRLKGVPTGGPYRLELRIDGAGRSQAERLTVKDVLVGDVWLLGGQSNMQGIGLLSEAEPPHPMVRAFYMTDRWGVARDPIHTTWNAVDPIHPALLGPDAAPPSPLIGAGPGVPFARQMHQLTGVPQGVIACAHGGSSMNQWDPKLKTLGGRSLYGAMVRRFVVNGGKVAGVAWHQGCSDAHIKQDAHYTRRMKALVRAMRRDFRNPRLPVVAAQISRVVGGGWKPNQWNRIREQQRRLPEVIPNLLVVPSIDLELQDAIHVGGRGQCRLGRRMAQAMWTLLKGPGAQKPPITLRRLAVRPYLTDNTAEIVVEYDNVIGRLCAPGRPSGFCIVAHRPLSCLYRVDLDGSRAMLRTSLPLAQAKGKFVCYGFGLDPYCNITDEADRSLPAMGPVKIP